MKIPVSALYLAFGALAVSVASGQTTFSNDRDAIIGTGSAAFTVGQTFTGFASVQGATWRVDSTSDSATTAGYRAHLGEWNTTTNSLVGGTLQLLGTTEVNRTAGQSGVPVAFSFSPVALDSTKTYALLFSYYSGSTSSNLVTGATDGNAFFNSGHAFYYTTGSDSGSFATALGSAPNFNYPDSDLMMSVQVSAIPEPSTYALIAGAVMLGFTVVRRSRRGKTAA